MKRSFLLLCLCSLLLAACSLDTVTSIGSHRIQPSSNIVSKEIPLDSFDRVEVDVMAGVQFVQTVDKNCRAVLTAPDNYLDLFQFRVKNGELEVEFVQERVNIVAERVNLVIYAPTLHKLENGGVADVRIDKLNSRRLEVGNSGVGNMTLSGLRVGELKAACEGVGNIELSGQSYRATLLCSGVGKIKAEELKANNVAGEVTGVGNITCYATDSIWATVSGVGSLKYRGTPQAKQLTRTGVGKIVSIKSE